MANNPVTESEVTAWIQEYDGGMTVEQMSKIYKRNAQTIYRHLTKRGVVMYQNVQPRSNLSIKHDKNARINPAIALMGCVDGFQWAEAS